MRALHLPLVVAAAAAFACAPVELAPTEHPRARALVDELVRSDEPGLAFFGWQHLEILGEGALPALGPLLHHADPMRQWKAYAIARPFVAAGRIPEGLELPRTITFQPERLLDALFLIAEDTEHSLIVHEGALAKVSSPLVVALEAEDAWGDLVAWCAKEPSLRTAAMARGLVIARQDPERRASTAEPPPEIDEAARTCLAAPLGVTGGTIYSRIMHRSTVAESLRVIEIVPRGAGLIVMPGAWANDERISYYFGGAEWYECVAAVALGQGLDARWFGKTLVLGAPVDALPPADALVQTSAGGESVSGIRPREPQVTFDELESSPVDVLALLAAQIGHPLALAPGVDERLALLPRSVRRGEEQDAERPWIHCRFFHAPGREALKLVARLLGLEVEVGEGQALVKASVPPSASGAGAGDGADGGAPGDK